MRQLLARTSGLALLGLLCNCSPPWATSEPPPPFIGSDPGVGQPFPQPATVTFGPANSLSKATAPIAGGTLIALPGATKAIAADPDHDVVWVVDLKAHSVLRKIELPAGVEPGRLILDRKGRVHVALRRGGSEVSFDPTSTTDTPVVRPVCAAPRGLAYDPLSDSIHVACAGGELVTLPAAGGEATRTLHLDSDLRDVIVDGNTLKVSRFRSAELLTVDASGKVPSRVAPGVFASPNIRNGQTFEPAVAWRTIADPEGGTLMLHQRGSTEPVQTHSTTPSGPQNDVDGMVSGGGGGSPYGGGGQPDCGSIVHSALTGLGGAGGRVTFPQVLAVDVATNNDGSLLAVASAGMSHSIFSDSLHIFVRAELSNADFCSSGNSIPLGTKQPVAVAALDVDWIVQTRNPTGILQVDRSGLSPSFTLLADDGPEDSGHAIFHSTSGNGIACASCHPEGGEDGRTWLFDFGARRTQSLRAGILATKPFHWAGDEANLNALVDDVFVHRMGGPQLDTSYTDVLGKWLDRIPAIAPSAPDAAQIARGQALFNDNTLGCTSCHNGSKLTNNTSLDVGTGGVFQVPSLIGVAARGPWMHSGCAKQLSDRFTNPACSGGELHGHTSQLSSAQVADLVGYLQSL